jgi:predicted DNA-binding protein (MmcQ/YjbR family)
MRLAALRAFALGLPHTAFVKQWGECLVFKVAGKMFLIIALDAELADAVVFKCTPAEFDELTEIDGIAQAPYCAKRMWVRVGDLAALPALWEKLVSLRELDAAARMERRAHDVARLFPAAFVVMGHTHLPVERPLSIDAVYINTGSWSEESDDHGLVTPPAPRTHLVVEGRDGTHGELRRWVPGVGPARWRRDD